MPVNKKRRLKRSHVILILVGGWVPTQFEKILARCQIGTFFPGKKGWKINKSCEVSPPFTCCDCDNSSILGGREHNSARSQENLWNLLNLPHRIHGTGIFTYISHKNLPNVGEYTIHGSLGFPTLKVRSKPSKRLWCSWTVCCTWKVFHRTSPAMFETSMTCISRYLYYSITEDARSNNHHLSGLVHVFFVYL